jgi:hypothetical protein
MCDSTLVCLLHAGPGHGLRLLVHAVRVQLSILAPGMAALRNAALQFVPLALFHRSSAYGCPRLIYTARPVGDVGPHPRELVCVPVRSTCSHPLMPRSLDPCIPLNSFVVLWVRPVCDPPSSRISWWFLFLTMYTSRLFCHTFLLLHIVWSRQYWPNVYLWLLW